MREHTGHTVTQDKQGKGTTPRRGRTAASRDNFMLPSRLLAAAVAVSFASASVVDLNAKTFDGEVAKDGGLFVKFCECPSKSSSAPNRAHQHCADPC